MKNTSSSGSVLYLKKSNNKISNKKEVTPPPDSTKSLLVSRTTANVTTESLVPEPSTSTEKFQETLEHINDTVKNGSIQNVPNELDERKLNSENPLIATTDSNQLQTSYNRDIYTNSDAYKRRYTEQESTRPSLIHGFLATTGYPKFYIGESNCSWTLIAPHKQHVLLYILDLHLRCK